MINTLIGLCLFISAVLSILLGHSVAAAALTTQPDLTSGNIQTAAPQSGLLHNNDTATPDPAAGEPPFIIYYGLNGSHSRDWVRENADGVIGITVFQRFDGSYDEGVLIYKTIHPDGSGDVDTITTGVRLEKSVLLYDSLSSPHVFLARSNDTDQVIDHYFRVARGQWQGETIVHFNGQGGKFIYELSADDGPDHSFHLLILKTRSDVDSDDFMDAWLDSHLYHLTNATGVWENELILKYDMAYTYDMCIKSSIRQDIKVDREGYAHVTFAEQLRGSYDPSRLWYATNKTGIWQKEIALDYDQGTVDDAGWFPSLSLDNNDIPYIACTYLKRVPTHSVTSCTLLLLTRSDSGDWQSEVIARYDDGYYGSDGRDYTGALCHLVFDRDNTPHVAFSDIASTHWDFQRQNVGNIRYGELKNGVWNFSTIYRQPLPGGFLDATEMHAICLILPEKTDSLRIIGQELEVTGEYQYTCRLVDFAWAEGPTGVEGSRETVLPDRVRLSQNHPNPFNSATHITFSVPSRSHVTVEVFNILGLKIKTLIDEIMPAGGYQVTWDGVDSNGRKVSSGMYFYRFQAGDFVATKKVLLIK